MRHWIECAGWCFTGMVICGFVIFMSYARQAAMPTAPGYQEATYYPAKILPLAVDDLPRLSTEMIGEFDD